MTYAARKIRLIMELRTQGIVDTRVLAAIERIPREQFVATNFVEQAYDNKALPIDCGQTISQPLVVAMMTQALELEERQKVLEVGTGSGYQTAILSRLCRRVYTIERHRDLLKIAEQRFQDLKLHNITALHGDGGRGWPQQAPFERIIVTAAAPEPPQRLLSQLADGGILVAPIDAGPETMSFSQREREGQKLVRFQREGNTIKSENLMDVRFVPLLPGAATA